MKNVCYGVYVHILLKHAVKPSGKTQMADVLLNLSVQDEVDKYAFPQKGNNDYGPYRSKLLNCEAELTAPLIESFSRDIVKTAMPRRFAADILPLLKDVDGAVDELCQLMELDAGEQKLSSADFLSKVFLAAVTETNNLDGKETIKRLFSSLSKSKTAETKRSSVGRFNNLPFRRNPNFTGRKEILDAIHDSFQQGGNVSLTQTVSGLGGIGKTQTALEYAYYYEKDYSTIWWATAETQQGLTTDYRAFARSQDLPGVSTEDELAAAVKGWFDDAANGGWLIIFDNVDDFDVLEPFLPSTANGHILVTTRLFDLPPRFDEKVDIAVFEPVEAITFLHKRTKREDEQAGELSLRLGYLPLALEQAAAYIRKTSETFGAYLALLAERGLKLFEEDVHITDYKKTINATWGISIEKIAGESEAARQLFNLCAYFAPDNIPIGLFAAGAASLPEELRGDMGDRLTRNRVVSAITKYSLMQRNSDFLSMHRLLQEVVRNNLEGDKRWLVYCVELMSEVLGYEYGDADSRRDFERMVPHVLEVANHAYILLREDEDADALGKTAYLYGELAGGFIFTGQYEQALECYQKDLEIYEEILDTEHPESNVLYYNIAAAYGDLGEYDTALTWYDGALSVRKVVNGENSAAVAAVYERKAVAYNHLDDPNEALKWAFMARDIYESLEGDERDLVDSVYSDIALSYMIIGEHETEHEKRMEAFEKSLEQHKKVIEIRERVHGLDHPDTAGGYTNIAMVYDHKEDFSEALKWNFKALRIFQSKLGGEHPYTATAYNNIALVFNHMEDYKKALEWHFKDLRISEKVLGADHPDTAVCYLNIGLAYDNDGQFAESLKWYMKGYRVYLAKFGEDCEDAKQLRYFMSCAYAEMETNISFEDWFAGELKK